MQTRFYKEKECLFCGVTFKPSTGSQKYCSSKCSYKKRMNDLYKVHIGDTVKCSICSKKFVVSTGGAKYCSKKCNRKAHYIWRKGSKVEWDKKKKLDRINGKKRWKTDKVFVMKQKELSALIRIGGNRSSNSIIKKVLAFMQIYKRKITDKSIIDKISEGETHLAYENKTVVFNINRPLNMIK